MRASLAAMAVVLWMPWAPALLPASTSTIVDLSTVVKQGSNVTVNQSTALFINSEGDVAGKWYDANGFYAFFYSGITQTAKDLGTLGGTHSQPNGLNAYGQVTGYADTTAGGNSHGFLYSGVSMADLGTLGGNLSYGLGINNSGAVVGQAYVNSSTAHASLWNPGAQDLGTLSGGSSAEADFINDNGQIAGYSSTSSGTEAFYYQSGGPLVGLTLGGNNSRALGINSGGQVVGKSNLIAGGKQNAFVYTPGSGIVGIGTLNNYAGNSDARSINSNGWVVGQSDVAIGQFHAYLYSPVNSTWVMTDLGTLNGGAGNSTPVAINSAGEIVGMASTAGGGLDPFLYLNGTMIDLNSLLPPGSPFTQLTSVTGISDTGVIVGQGTTTSGRQDGYILFYSDAQLPEIPTPVSTGLGLVVCGLGATRYRRRYS